jgi:hypothetical protein
MGKAVVISPYSNIFDPNEVVQEQKSDPRTVKIFNDLKKRTSNPHISSSFVLESDILHEVSFLDRSSSSSIVVPYLSSTLIERFLTGKNQDPYREGHFFCGQHFFEGSYMLLLA